MRKLRLVSLNRSLFPYVLATVIIAIAAHSVSFGQTNYKVGDRIDAEWRPGRWYTAQIIEVKDGQYKVRYELDGVVDTVPPERIRRVGGSASANQANSTPVTQSPKMSGAFPSLRGTAWKIDFGKGVTGTVFLFCKNAPKWEIVPQRAGTIGAIGKSYAVSGGTLTTVNATDGLVQKWKMTWKAGILEIFDGKGTLKLHYNGETQC